MQSGKLRSVPTLGKLSVCFTFGISVFAIAPGEPLSNLTMNRWGTQQGVPEETFAAILAPGDGDVWLAANHGLVRFDGERAQVFRLGDRYRPNGTGSCSSNTMSSLLLGADGNIWSGASSGCIFLLQRDRFGSFANFRFSAMDAPDLGRETNTALSLLNLNGAKDVAVIRRSGIGVIATASFPPAHSGPSQPKSVVSTERKRLPAPPGLRITLSTLDPAGKLWAVMTDNLLYRESGDGSAWEKQAPWAGTSGAFAQKIMAARNGGAIWIGSTRGLFEWKDGSSRHWTIPGDPRRQQIVALHEDRAGCVWMGRPEAISRLCNGRVETLPLGVEDEEVQGAIAEDPQGNIWLAGRWGNLYRLSSPIFQNYTHRSGMPESHFTGVAVDLQGDVWASTRQSGVVRLVDGRPVNEFRTPGIAESQTLLAHPAGGVLTASTSGIFRVVPNGANPIQIDKPPPFRLLGSLAWQDSRHLLYSNADTNYRLRRNAGPETRESWTIESLSGPARIRQWARDPGGTVWALSQFQGLHRLEGSVYRPAPNARPERARAWYSISGDREGLLWIGTTDGLEIYSTTDKRYLTDRPLLFGDQIFHMAEDRFGKIWCATRQGIVRFTRAQALLNARSAPLEPLAVERFGAAESLATTNFGLVTSATGAAAPDGRIWFPGLRALVSLQPADFEPEPRAPAAQLLELNVDGNTQDLNQPLSIAPGSKSIEFLFKTLRLDPLGGEFCRVRLNGFDPAWSPCNEPRTQQYTNLPPGRYEFVIQTSSQADTWNGKELHVPLIIQPALHQIIWVQFAAALALLACLGFLVWNRQKTLVQRNRWLEERVEDRTATLARATHAAEAANRAKSEFLAIMSHEIRTPMNGVLGAVQILDHSRLNAEQQKLVSVIRQSSEDLVGIVDDILNLAKVEAGKLTLERTAVTVSVLSENLLALFRPKAEPKGVALRLQIDDKVPAVIYSDPQRLRQILLNLVGNAVKFTASGEVRLRITASEEAKTICFSVEDTGVGIAPGKIPSLFAPFVQADSSTTRRFGGSGLGLSIVRRFVDAMNGSIEVESELGKGSTFRVNLPLDGAPDLPVEALAETPEFAIPSGLTVLLAEDNHVNQMVCQKMLARLGCQVIVANDGRQALEALRVSQVDLILMDCQMPELDGYQTTRELRAWGGAFEHLPVIALTASAMAEDRQHCVDAGMNDFLSKPLMLSALESAVARWGSRS